MGLIRLAERVLYTLAYAGWYVAWNMLLKHAWRLIGHPIYEAIKAVILRAEREDAVDSARRSLDLKTLTEMFYTAIYRATANAVREGRSAASAT